VWLLPGVLESDRRPAAAERARQHERALVSLDIDDVLLRIVAAAAREHRHCPSESTPSADHQSGASGFLLKDAPEEHLLAAIRIVADGGSLFAPTVSRRLIERFAALDGAAATPPNLDALTAREVEVLRLLARRRSNAEIAAELVVSEHTVKTHVARVARVLGKLDLRDRIQAVILAYESGLVRPSA
jgi:DNA-binding NarL/FixJ family response regulator